MGTYALYNIPATRSISFARFIPKLVTKFATAGAAAGGAVIAGASYLQYQAGQAGNFAVGLFNKTKDGATDFANEAYGTATGVLDQMSRGWEKTKGEVSSVEYPEWLQRLMAKDDGSGSGGGSNCPQAVSYDPMPAYDW